MIVTADNLLLEEVEQKSSTAFVQTDEANNKTVQYKVLNAGPESDIAEGKTVILKPAYYELVQIDGKTLTHAKGEDVLVIL